MPLPSALPLPPLNLQPHRPSYFSNRPRVSLHFQMGWSPHPYYAEKALHPSALASSSLTQLLSHVFVPVHKPSQTLCTWPNSTFAASYLKAACPELPPFTSLSPGFSSEHPHFPQPSAQCLLPWRFSCSLLPVQKFLLPPVSP